MSEGVQFRPACALDRDALRAVYISAFGEDERDAVAALAQRLLSDPGEADTLSLVAEAEGRVIGHVAFSPLELGGAADVSAFILAPLGVMPSHHRRGVGVGLIRAGFERLAGAGVDFVLVYGDPSYYERFGFDVAVARAFTPPYPLQYAFGWQGLALSGREIEEPPVAVRCVPALCDPTLW